MFFAIRCTLCPLEVNSTTAKSVTQYNGRFLLFELGYRSIIGIKMNKLTCSSSYSRGMSLRMLENERVKLETDRWLMVSSIVVLRVREAIVLVNNGLNDTEVDSFLG